MEQGVRDRRKRPDYSLDRIRELAKSGKVDYATARVARDIANLGYPKEVVCDCLSKLSTEHFHESILYENQRTWLDVYKCGYVPPAEVSEYLEQTESGDSLYIKLRLNRDRVSVLLFSFHREGSLS